MSIIIKELFGSDNVLALVEKINQNFDSLILAGGGPAGAIGVTGIQGVAGPGGIRGSQWFGASGSTGTINLPTDGIYRENDFRLVDGGLIEYYNNNIWNDTNLSITGPQGPQGEVGDGSIAILGGNSSLNIDYSQNQFTPDYTQISKFLSKSISANDTDDSTVNSSSYINSGLDFIGIGRGNNSLVLGRYASLFKNDTTAGVTGGTTDSKYSPPLGNLTIGNFPLEQQDVPMLILSQNDYKDPSDVTSEFTNGISIGLTKTHQSSQYDNSFYYGSGQNGEMNYNNFANLSIINRHFDFEIKNSTLLTIKNESGGSSFRLGSNVTRPDFTNIHDNSTKLESPHYTEFVIDDSFLINLTSGFIKEVDYDYTQNNKSFATQNDIRKNVSKSFITNESFINGDGNELVLSNNSLLSKVGIGDTNILDKTYIDYSDDVNFDSNISTYPFRIGQTVVDTKITSISFNEPIYQARPSRINLSYQGFGYDQSLVSYSGIDDTYIERSGVDVIPSIQESAFSSTDAPSLLGVVIQDSTLQNYLGYDITSPLENQTGSRSMSRMGLYPGLFRQEKDSVGSYDTINDSASENRKDKFFDVAHKMLPTGSLDVYGTIRLREQETTDDGNKDGYVAVNKKNGIVSFEEPNLINAVPTFAIMSFPEMASDKFSFYTKSTKNLGFTSSNAKAHDYKEGSTSGVCAAFIGKGSKELKDYYICNGAIMADSRDIIATGPYSKMEGMNVNSNSEYVADGDISSDSDFKWNINSEFSGINGETKDSYSAGGYTLSQFAVDRCNAISPTYQNWGYSVLSPDTADSKFRVVLPNYFGKVAKMVFPDSDFIVRAVSGNVLTHSVSGVDDQPYTGGVGYKYYTSGNTYNKSWMLQGCFDIGGFPYLQGANMPNIRLTEKKNVDIIRDIENFGYNESFAGDSSVIKVSEYTQTSGPSSEGVYTNNVWYGEHNGLDDYRTNSNWIQYDDKFTSSQKFVQPPYKGTLMAINLKGIRNPNRNDTLIPSLHYIAGVPICGAYISEDKESDDMSWYSTLGTPSIQGDFKHCTTSWLYTQQRDVFYNCHINGYENGYKSIGRNDDTMHPYTYYDTSSNNYETQLEYNNNIYSNTSWEKQGHSLYKTNISKESDYDLNVENN